MGKIQRECDWCGKAIFRYPSQFAGKQRVFSSQKEHAAFHAKGGDHDEV